MVNRNPEFASLMGFAQTLIILMILLHFITLLKRRTCYSVAESKVSVEHRNMQSEIKFSNTQRLTYPSNQTLNQQHSKILKC